jgi:hypothetical protein
MRPPLGELLVPRNSLLVIKRPTIDGRKIITCRRRRVGAVRVTDAFVSRSEHRVEKTAVPVAFL